VFAIHDALAAAGYEHAFGGALALAYCTEEPRGTRDIDVNIFSAAEEAANTFEALPEGIAWDETDLDVAARDGQVRLWWDDTPIDIFLTNMEFHSEVGARVREVVFAGRQVPMLDCRSLAVFKALFDRTKDWADIEAIAARDTGPLEEAVADVAKLAGSSDEIRARLIRVIEAADPGR